jgi:hypothetical protein
MKPFQLVLAIFVGLLASSSAPANAPTMAQFRIEVREDAGRLSLECSSGCAWQTLTVDCSSDQPCVFVLDQNGMGQ